MAEKEVSISLTFKQLVLDTDDAAFNATLQEAMDSVKAKLTDARVQYVAAKDAVVDGVPTLEEKGVSVSIGITF